MRAAVLHELGVPRADEFDEPQAGDGQAIVQVLAAGLNPVDVAISAGASTPARHRCRRSPGARASVCSDDRRVYFDSPILPYGSMAERALIDPQATYDVPDGVPDGVAVALGISGLAAWLALTWRAQLQPGEHVLLLAASGVLGQIAVQAAKSLGAARVVAAARSQEGLQRCLELGADAAVALDGSDDLAGRLAEAAEGRIDVVVDPLFGESFAAAVEAASFGARLVQLGAGAGNESTVSSAPIRGKMLVIMGHTNFAAPPDVKRDAYASMSAQAASGELKIESEPVELERVGEAWERLQAGSHRKIVLVPPGV